jgi:hypothetical protein
VAVRWWRCDSGLGCFQPKRLLREQSRCHIAQQFTLAGAA